MRLAGDQLPNGKYFNAKKYMIEKFEEFTTYSLFKSVVVHFQL